MRIPSFMDRDNYLQNPIMRRFLRDHNLNLVYNRADYLREIENFANTCPENEEVVTDWLLKIVKEGTKEICYKKLYDLDDWYSNADLIHQRIQEKFPECPQQDLIHFTSTDDRTLINYRITCENGEVVKLEFTFSKLFLCGNPDQLGDKVTFPVFIEVYLQKGFIVGRGKAKSTLYHTAGDNSYIVPDDKVDVMNYIVETMDLIADCFEFKTETNRRIVATHNSQMLYRLYQKYSFTPDEVVAKVNTQREFIFSFASQLFNNLGLDRANLEKSLLDLRIFAEKFISINGDNEDVFKNDRDAYLIKVTTNDDLDSTKIDTISNRQKPLQCTEAFYDSKKSVVRSQTCSKLYFVFKRENNTYFSHPLVVQMGSKKEWGFIKTTQYAEEADIQNVLQTIFENY